MKTAQGRILKGIGGFYYVETEDGPVECRARGHFRNDDMTLLVGDMAEIEYDADKMKGVVNDICERKNALVRPAVSNVDKLYIVCSTVLPQPNLFNIDKLIAIALNNNIEPVLVISKTDLGQADSLREIYEKAGFAVYETNPDNKGAAEQIKNSLSDKISVFTGNSGVGKSTLINAMFPELLLKTGEVSLKLSRGRHTTRHVELFPLLNGGYLADTPGFSSIDFEQNLEIEKDEVISCFPDFAPFVSDCRFPDCLHIGERECSLKKAVENGEVSPSRYESYVALCKEAEKIKPWEKQGRSKK
ncbi:MAG: ribosome small subunit-dependent GTPase A [Oscillospiraceae bacterium]|nr:ribosome small subunit-dependent GTPase A [Oscillospiraceae bacterium]